MQHIATRLLDDLRNDPAGLRLSERAPPAFAGRALPLVR